MSLVKPRKSVVEAMRILVDTLHREYGWFNGEELENTPRRVAKFFEEWNLISEENEHEVVKKFSSTYDGIIIDSGIDFIALCSHHLLPVVGKMTIAYVPRMKKDGEFEVLGLSKLSRIAKRHMYKPLIQEEFTEKVLEDIKREIDPVFVFVMVTAQHDCKRLRGAKDIDSWMTTVRIFPNDENGRKLEEKVMNYLKVASRG